MKNRIILTCFLCIFAFVNTLTAQNPNKGKILVEVKMPELDYPLLLSDLGFTIGLQDKKKYTYAQVKEKNGADSIYMGTDLGLLYGIELYTHDTLIEGKDYIEFVSYIGESIIEPYLLFNKHKSRYSSYIHSRIYYHKELNVDTIFNGTTRIEVTMIKEINNEDTVWIKLLFFENNNLISYCVYSVYEKNIPRKIRKKIPKVEEKFYFKME